MHLTVSEEKNLWVKEIDHKLVVQFYFLIISMRKYDKYSKNFFEFLKMIYSIEICCKKAFILDIACVIVTLIDIVRSVRKEQLFFFLLIF